MICINKVTNIGYEKLPIELSKKMSNFVVCNFYILFGKL